MNNIDITTSKSYATEANLTKGTAKVDAMIQRAIENNDLGATDVRRVVCRTPDAAARWTVIYVCSGRGVQYGIWAAHEGFQMIG